MMPPRSSRSLLLIAAIGVALAGCAGKTRPATGPAMVQAIDNGALYGDVVARLEQGDVKAARKALEAMVKRDPADARAAMLLETITGDPRTVLGPKSFAYTARQGDTFPVLAQRYLGNRDKFYALARYNGTDNPSGLAAGTMLRIPGDEPRAVAAPAPAKPRPAPPAAARPATVLAKPAVTPAKPAANPARANQLRAQGLAALNRGQVARAVVLLHQAVAANPGSAVIRADLARAQRVRNTVKARR